ncbi:hypothetical protein GIB67_021636 [Kingdonia uniflora]|uniref:SNF2 N-terminal domain-containing protein n=1 Tax=Kingdonia uniflora TaxID=39325 RepID=A0A7J7KYB5_9MAGN|nr:hypothetical protein GIB67_021636 [Kingdonia uniflora]
MTDTTDDIAIEISFQSFEDDYKLLGSLLNDVLQRESACNMRMVGIENTAELLEKQFALEMSEMALEEALILARALSHYFDLMAIAETHHREGVQFMFDYVSGLTTSPDNYGCILVDGMSLGKTLQSITLMYTLLRHGSDGEPLVKKAIYT